MKYCLSSVLVVTLLLCVSGVSPAKEWSSWQKLDDGALNGIEFSFSDNCPPGGAVDCNLSWRFLSNYETDVMVEYTIAWDTGAAIREQSVRTTLKPGENRDASFTVIGAALDEVSVKIVADKQVLEAARTEVEAERKRVEIERRVAEETIRRRIAEQPRLRIEVTEARRRGASRGLVRHKRGDKRAVVVKHGAAVSKKERGNVHKATASGDGLFPAVCDCRVCVVQGKSGVRDIKSFRRYLDAGFLGLHTT